MLENKFYFVDFDHRFGNILKILDKTIGLRVDEESEVSGLDISQHGESGYSF